MRDFLDLPALTGACGNIILPGSKSISNRVLLLAALSHGVTRISNFLESEDTDVMQAALKALGVSIQKREGVFWVRGSKGKIPNQQGEFFLGNAGTAFRFLTAVLSLSQGHYVLSGTPRMHERPIGDLTDALKQIGAHIQMENEGFPPLNILPFEDNQNRTIYLKGNVSSQFLSALLMALPLTQNAYTIRVEGNLISKPYVQMTLSLMRTFGVEVESENNIFKTPANAHYQAVEELKVEGDASSASYFWGLGALLSEEGIFTEGIMQPSIQGDVAFLDALTQMGAKVTKEKNRIGVKKGSFPLKPIHIDANDFPDAAMTLATLALFANGTSRITNIASWKVKETDRLEAMQNELQKTGAKVETGEDWMSITPPQTLKTLSVATYNDHRMAMSFALLSAKIPLRIENPECVEKTFPTFFKEWEKLVQFVPVIAIDGPSASGKGTVAQKVAQQLGFHYLDSGALYRLTAFFALQKNIALTVENEEELAQIARNLPVTFQNGDIFLKGEKVTEEIRTEEMGKAASIVAAFPKVREALLFLQRTQRQLPGLVGDGRDMGSVIFQNATLKIYLDASVTERAQRRYKQLKEKGFSANLPSLIEALQKRDEEDKTRANAPLRHQADAVWIDTEGLTVEEVTQKILALYRHQ